MKITDLQQDKLAELGDKPIEASIKRHRHKLEITSNKALQRLDDALTTDEATIDQTIKIYDTTRKHLNTIDGRQDSEQQNIIIMPVELIERQQKAIEAEIIEQTSITNKTQNDSESKTKQHRVSSGAERSSTG